MSNTPNNKCKYCGKEIVTAGLLLDDGIHWLYNKPCDCEEAQEEVRKKQAEIERRREEERERERLRWFNIHVKNSGLHDVMLNKKLCNYVPNNESQQKALNICKDYVQPFIYGKKLYISGSPGVGKTHLVIGIVQELIKNNIKTFYVTNYNFKRLVNPYNNIEHLEFIEKCNNATVLVIDDIGTELASDGYISALYGVIDHRYTNNKALILTSNYSLHDLANKLSVGANIIQGVRIVDRIRENCEKIIISGTSYRGKGER